ncbi:hypothetical protein [Ruminococcus sp. XPD3002]|uniref:hypothetical protein n=1 Tax=Ruminococcus sp. XPD3002 TaxID=1452269 RepID=UPI00091AFFF5|nr:hypothetical protein SAMN04487832_10292 [Ruminococcus flavefaciens]
MKKIRIILSLLPFTVLTGCSFGASIDTLMAPPKLSVEQEQIFAALTKAEGSAISLKYPKSGKYLSAFIIEDLDGDGGNEAVVFYERNSITMDENQLRINILDEENGEWSSVYDTSAEGPEIEKVMISKLGDNQRINLIIGCSSINRSEKNVSIYTYTDGILVRDFASAYSFIDVTDMDSNGTDDFLLISGAGSGTPATASAYMLDADASYHELFKCELNGTPTEFDVVGYGDVGNGRKGLYIDTASGSGNIQTDIIYIDSKGHNKVFATPEEAQITSRPAGFSSFDIDSDGVIEIPVQSDAPGYEEASESEKMKLTNWMYIGNNGRIARKYTSYYSIGDGYIFIFPEKWRNKVTVKRDAINDEIVFCAYADGKEGRELLHIFCAEDAASREDHISSGYMLLHTKGESAYLAYIPQSDSNSDGLSISEGDAAVGFRFRE